MSSSASTSSFSTPPPGRSSSSLPILVFVDGVSQRQIPLERTPFSVGRKSGKDLVVGDARVSRDHAQIISEGADFFLVDQGSKHGTFVNGARIERKKLERNDRMEFGMRDGAYLLFNPVSAQSTPAREFLSQIHGMEVKSGASDLEKLTLFLEAARKLNTTGVLDEVLVTLIEATLRLTGAERAYVFLRGPDGNLRLAAGRTHQGEPLSDDTTISHSIIEEAARAASEFLVTDTMNVEGLAGRQSIVANELRTVICIPLRKTMLQEKATESGLPPMTSGVLYLDSRFASGKISSVSTEILGAIATEAAALVENANLAQAEESAKLYQQQLAIAASIQQRLMAVTIPDVPYARLRAKNAACKDIGGDFFDVVTTPEGMAVVITDFCGKGIPAAILASTLQGMVYSQLMAHVPLAEIVFTTNRFLCQKGLGEKYATMVLARLSPTGELEYVNCGHVPPVLVAEEKAERIRNLNLPIGLLPEATYESERRTLKAGDHLVLVTDGVTEAEDASGEFFGDERLEAAASAAEPFDKILGAVESFCGDTPLNDDCTVVEVTYSG
jgi:serine phosphatase RsbU (regulator of sigma subunit)/pSer/pThr/pTyr-binding forkhead associated (FHA) protein